jgi:hypothetical protein
MRNKLKIQLEKEFERRNIFFQKDHLETIAEKHFINEELF